MSRSFIQKLLYPSNNSHFYSEIGIKDLGAQIRQQGCFFPAATLC